MSFLRILGILCIVTLGVIAGGFYVLYTMPDHTALAHKLVGLGNLFLFFGIMPAFIIARYRKKDLSSFTFNNKKDDDDWDEEDHKRF